MSDNPYAEVHSGEALTKGVRNVGGMAGQDFVHMPHTWYSQSFDVTVTETLGTAQAIVSSEGRLNAQGVYVNYIILQSSLRGNPVVCLPGSESLNWKTVNGIVVPEGIRVTGNPTRIDIPTRDNWVFTIAPYIAVPTLGYADSFTVYYGYLPGNQEHIPGLPV